MAHPVVLDTPLGPDKLLIRGMNGVEQLGRMFQYKLELLSSDFAIDARDILGRMVTLRMAQDSRFFTGYVTEFCQTGSIGRYASYSATVHPWLWLLSRRFELRIFQSMTVQQILQEVFGDYTEANFAFALTRSYPQREFCVQYRESDFNFVSRLMEDEGIYYYFTHTDGDHQMHIVDAQSGHEAAAGFATVPYGQLSEDTEGAKVFNWEIRHEVQTTSFALTSFDYEKPKAEMEVRSLVPDPVFNTSLEAYDYPGEYKEIADGDQRVRTRMEEQSMQQERLQGQTNAHGPGAGSLFKLDLHPRADQNREYLITTARYRIEAGAYESGDAAASSFSASWTCIDSAKVYRPPRLTPLPVVGGPQTATVVGPEKDGIWTDEYGRVKVQFHWDRLGQSNQDSSCWVRVSQNWAGQRWGGMFIPHVGHEVVVDFLEGNPDRPLVTGRVYNNINMPPRPLPGNDTRSVIQDHGGNFMEMEGAGGSQFIHLRQTCGNEVKLDGADGAEKVEVRDKHGNEFVLDTPAQTMHMKQPCGNKVILDGGAGSEGILIEDKYGNKMKLDAVAGFITISSPTHDSKIELGKSITYQTTSNTWETTKGDWFKFVGGETSSVQVGFKQDLFLGHKLSSTVGVSHTYDYAKVVSVNFKTRERRSKGAIKYDSEERIHLIGGADDKAQLWLDSDYASLEVDYKHWVRLEDKGIHLKTPAKLLIEVDEVEIKVKKDIKISCNHFELDAKTWKTPWDKKG